DKIWLNYTHTLFGGLKDLTDMSDPTIEASSLIKTSYKKLANRLSYAYDVVVFPFDWRKPLPVSAQAFNDKIIELLKYNQPVKIIGHSMGGVLVRDFIINHDATWQRLNASKGFKMLFLGSPLGGSVRIMTVLFGVDSIINSLNKLDRVHSKKELLTMFSGMPGLLCLLPLSTDVGNDFADVQTWIDFRSVCGDDCWPIPKQSDLDAFRVYRDHVLEKRESIDYTNMIYIAGKDKATPFGCRCNKDLPELEFLATAEGDQSVTWESGIPQQLHDAKAVYYVDVSHGQLANDPKIFGGIEELLERGTTSQLSRSKPQVRGEEKVFRMPPSYVFDPSQWGIEEALFGSSVPEQEIASSQIPVTISVSNGDLAYASFPVMVGHFKNDGILYAEKAIDHKLDKILSARHDLGLYPGDIGSSDVLLNHCEEESFKGAIIVGLGEAGHLTAHLLAKTVAQGVANYLLNIKNQTAYKGHIGISTLIIGCGYGGLSQESSIKAIMEGVYEANEKVSKLHKAGSRTIQHIEFVEVYEEKAVGALYALSKLQRKEGQTLNFMVGEQGIKKLFGAKRRLLYDASEDWWHRITVKFKHSTEGPYERSSLVFGAATGDAREEERQLYSSTALIDLFVGQVSTENNWSARSAKTLFELMIPNDFKERLKRKGNITLVLDKATAAYPWELLQDHTHNAEPLCVGAGMIRQLSTANYRISIKRVANDRALVIG
ncbi:MAG TPA: hypothetical protein VL947_13490, partial [Cytophagales bacterium]|nr:hypothetical protein [Cytophagales bacterium]